jgi:hypothetical protein
MDVAEELNERQQSLIGQVKAGQVTEQEPDTESQLLTLARLGHLEFTHDESGYHFRHVTDDPEQATQEAQPGSDIEAQEPDKVPEDSVQVPGSEGDSGHESGS